MQKDALPMVFLEYGLAIGLLTFGVAALLSFGSFRELRFWRKLVAAVISIGGGALGVIFGLYLGLWIHMINGWPISANGRFDALVPDFLMTMYICDLIFSAFVSGLMIGAQIHYQTRLEMRAFRYP